MTETSESQAGSIVEEPQKSYFLAKIKSQQRKILLGILGVLAVTGLLFVSYRFGRVQVKTSDFEPRLKPLVTSPSPQVSTGMMGQLDKDVEVSHSAMWIGAHADDEMFVAGTLGYLCKDKGYRCTIVSFGASPKMKEGNAESANFLNQADYIRIQERLKGGKNNCSEKNYDCFVNQWQENGSQDELAKIIQEKKPDIVFTFGTSQEYGAKDIHAASAFIAQQAMRLAGGVYHHYYVINTMHLLTKDADSEIQKATDIIGLSPQLWGYRMKVIGIYAPFYSPNDLLRMVNDKAYQDTLLHKELFKRVESSGFPSGGEFICPESKTLDCMPTVVREGEENQKEWLCSKEYLDWAKENCPGLEITY